MEQRELGTTGIRVSPIGLGAWQLAEPRWGAADPAEATRIVRQALESGCDFFDTAPGYGAGRSEELLGHALKQVRRNVTICTKFGMTPQGTRNDAVAAIRPALEGSLRRLKTDYIDVYLLHSPPSELLDGRQAAHYAELEQLKSEGKLRTYGVSVDFRSEIETVLNTTRSGVLEVLFNVFHQEPVAAFAQARRQGVGIIVKVPLDSGWLSGSTTPIVTSTTCASAGRPRLSRVAPRWSLSSPRSCRQECQSAT